MKQKLNLILLIDDSESANFLHQKVIREIGCAEKIHIETNATDALRFLNTEDNERFPQPEIIFLDLNMPGMNGWDFLEEYKKMDRELRWGTLIVILTTSRNPDDEALARVKHPNSVFLHKPLLRTSLEKILQEHFAGRI